MGFNTFRGDNRTFAVILLVPAHDRALRVLRHEAAWMAAASAIRPLDVMTSPQAAQPLTGVMPMGGLSNVLRTGDPRVRRLVAVGDALCHTNPSYAFGLAFALVHAQRWRRAASAAPDADSVAEAYREDVGPEARERFAFACDTDAARVRAWRGERLAVGARGWLLSAVRLRPGARPPRHTTTTSCAGRSGGSGCSTARRSSTTTTSCTAASSASSPSSWPRRRRRRDRPATSCSLLSRRRVVPR